MRPVLVELSSQRSKKEFFDKTKEIKDKLGITLANDCSKNKREDYNKLKEIQKSLKNEGIDTKIRKSKLQYNGKLYDLKKASRLEKNIKYKRMEKEEVDSDNSITSVNSQMPSKKRAASASPREVAEGENKIKSGRKGKKERLDINKTPEPSEGKPENLALNQ